MDRIVRRHRTIPRPLDQRTPPKPPDQRTWSSKDARATHASRGRHRHRWPRVTRPPERPASPVATTAAVEAYRASRNHRCRWVWGAPLQLVWFGSDDDACPHAPGASPSLDPGGTPPPVACLRAAPPLALGITTACTPEGTAATLACPRELPPSLKPNPW
jgi:hypothetical protein